MICYTPEQFDVIKSGGFQYKVSQETIDIIQLISTQVGAPTYVRTPTFSKFYLEPGSWDILRANLASIR